MYLAFGMYAGATLLILQSDFAILSRTRLGTGTATA
jgi:hypothetical protein